ncbi:MAG: MogA/MoaB family molybdenum cofactor biosynthesis protein [Deltaproteobacteria bacterium]|nr:MogA/MoaB family molybdenum cofactor biosynthesis protein [Deltaproteobacteria bacterium]MCB9490113.1 MogA/MoaB family molybdenum cofactor biosynthesis protein [Deltaproteobacteria bacterium]
MTSEAVIRYAVLTISDRSFRGERPDEGGPRVRAAMDERGAKCVAAEVLPDEQAAIENRLRELCDGAGVDLILTTGGTGVAPRDVTPEATLAVAERLVPGMAEAMRAASLAVTPMAMISRAVAAIRGRTLIVNLPGSPKGAIECLDVVAPVLNHAVRLLRAEADEHAPKTT